MINFRFHLISLVAVFLALGVGVAMGASFVDRATVDSLRGRVDALESNYRQRGAALDATRAELADSDRQAAALSGGGSRALASRLADVPVVVIATAEVDDDVLEATGTSLRAAGAQLGATMRLTRKFQEPSKSDLAAARARFGLKGTGDVVVARIATDLGTSLSLLSAAPPAPGAGTTSTTAAPSASQVPAPGDVDQARGYIAALSDLGLVTVGDGAGVGDFPAGSGYRYVVVVDADDRLEPVVAPMVRSVGSQSAMTTTVAEARSERPDGEATTTTAGQPATGATIAPFRSGDIAAQVSTVDDLDEAFGRIAVVYALAEQRDLGRSGHYGTGSDATGPFPTVPAR